MARAGLALAPANAVAEVKRAAHWVARRRGGDGAVREAVELLLKSRRAWPPRSEAAEPAPSSFATAVRTVLAWYRNCYERRPLIIILTLVVVFISVVVGVLIHRARTPRAIPTEAAASKADYRIKEVRLQEAGRDGSRWQLDAEYAETFEEQNTTSMKKVTIEVDQPPRARHARSGR